MARLEDLRQDLRAMNPDELRAKLREIRGDRRISKESGKTKKTKAKSEDKAKNNMQSLMAGMSPEELAAIIKELEG